MTTHVAALKKDGLGHAPAWMIAMLELNPSYTSWWPGLDCMKGPADEGGFDVGIAIETWGDFEFPIDSHNLCANFYFEIATDTTTCTACKGKGWRPGITPDQRGTESNPLRINPDALCVACEGKCEFRIGDPYLSLTLWLLHPRKGASRGATIKRIESEEQAIEAKAWLRRAARNTMANFQALLDDTGGVR